MFVSDLLQKIKQNHIIFKNTFSFISNIIGKGVIYKKEIGNSNKTKISSVIINKGFNLNNI